ncbi:MAG: D-alanyl-D-alanine carboxypeptidase family protein [Clostridia bacterium]
MKEKQITRIITILLLVSIILCPGYVKADDEEEEEIQDNEIQELIVESSTEAVEEPIINARAAVIYDRTTKKIMWGKNENTKKAMASTTKIMTATVVLEKANLSDMVTISKKAAGTGGSRLKINTGDKITVRDLLYGLMLRSRK